METYYDRLKNLFEVERFSGRTVRSIEQDFFGVLFLTTWESVLGKPADAELAQKSAAAQCQPGARVNHAVSYLALVDHTVALLLDPPGTVQETLAPLHFRFKTTPTLSRPGRRFSRYRRAGFRRAGFIGTSYARGLNLLALHRGPVADVKKPKGRVWAARGALKR